MCGRVGPPRRHVCRDRGPSVRVAVGWTGRRAEWIALDETAKGKGASLVGRGPLLRGRMILEHWVRARASDASSSSDSVQGSQARDRPDRACHPSVLLQKSLAHSAMDAYIGVHGYYDQEVAIATGGSTDSRVLGCGLGRCLGGQVERAKVVLAASGGESSRGIAASVGIARDTARLWMRRYEAEGLDGIESDRPRSGRPRTVTRKVEEKIVQKTTGEDPPPEESTHWTSRLMGKALGIDHVTIWRSGASTDSSRIRSGASSFPAIPASSRSSTTW